MKFIRKLPKDFFTKERPHIEISNELNNEIEPIKWSQDVNSGKYRNKVLVDIPKSKLTKE